MKLSLAMFVLPPSPTNTAPPLSCAPESRIVLLISVAVALRIFMAPPFDTRFPLAIVMDSS
eukprot:7384595-Prymnesium_polylepis.1